MTRHVQTYYDQTCTGFYYAPQHERKRSQLGDLSLNETNYTRPERAPEATVF